MLRSRERLSLDLLERWGTDLLEALVALDRAGVDHRDIKPANLGVREGRSDRAKHLVLFDFSLSRAGAAAVTAGTPPYLDPFLDAPGTGTVRLGRGTVLRRRGAVRDGHRADPEVRRRAVRPRVRPRRGHHRGPACSTRPSPTALVPFFRTALARNAKERHRHRHRHARRVAVGVRPGPQDHPRRRRRMRRHGRAGDPAGRGGPVRPGPVRAGALRRGHRRRPGRGRPGAAEPAAPAWPRRPAARSRPGPGSGGTSSARRHRPRPRPPGRTGTGQHGAARPGHGGRACSWPTPGRRGPRPARDLPACCSASTPGLDPFASQNELAAVLGVTRARVAQQVGALQDGWADHPACRDLLDTVAETARQCARRPRRGRHRGRTGRRRSGCIASALTVRTPRRRPGSQRACCAWPWTGRRRCAGPTPGGEQISTRRRDGRIVLLAADPALLDPAEALGRTADDLVAQARSAGDPLVPAGARPRSGSGMAGPGPARASRLAAGLGDGRLLRLAAALARNAVLSGSNELYHRDLSVTDALALALRERAGAQAVAPHEIRDRVRARFPALPPLPDRPRLDQLIATPGSAWSTTTPSTATAGRPAPPTPRTWPPGRPPSPRPRARNWSPAAGPGTGWRRARPPGRSWPSAWTPTAPTAPSRR